MKVVRGPGRLLTAMAFAAGCFGAPSVAVPAEKLTEFQWTLMSGGSLLLVPIDGVLYPAKLANKETIETKPVRVSVTLYETNEKMTPSLHSVVSPFDLDPSQWSAQRRVGDKWIDAGTYVFVDGRFYVMESPAALAAVDPAMLRFVPIKQR